MLSNWRKYYLKCYVAGIVLIRRLIKVRIRAGKLSLRKVPEPCKKIVSNIYDVKLKIYRIYYYAMLGKDNIYAWFRA